MLGSEQQAERPGTPERIAKESEILPVNGARWRNASSVVTFELLARSPMRLFGNATMQPACPPRIVSFPREPTSYVLSSLTGRVPQRGRMRKVLFVGCLLMATASTAEARHWRWHWHGHYFRAAPYAYGFAAPEDSLQRPRSWRENVRPADMVPPNWQLPGWRSILFRPRMN